MKTRMGTLMTGVVVGVSLACGGVALADQPSNKEENMTKQIIIYFSRADENYGVGDVKKGNTEYVAEFIRDETGADLFKVEPKNPYPRDYSTCVQVAQERQQTHDAPIVEPVPDITSYDTVYIGSPVYWGRMPEELRTALSGLDLTGKTVNLFVTHEGSAFGDIPQQLEIMFPKVSLNKTFEIEGRRAVKARNRVSRWLKDKP